MTINIFILEDHDDQRLLLRRTLATYADVVVVGEAGTIKEAEALIMARKPDLLLMDIELADGNAFRLLEKLADPPPVIFTSGHREYAVDAFGLHALDYLVKPFTRERLAEALDRYRESRATPDAKVFESGRLLLLRQGAKIFFVPVTDLVSIEASREYTSLRDQSGRTYVEKRPLRYWVERLPTEQFVQLDRSTVVNVGLIDHVVQRSPLEMALYMKAHAEPLSLGRAASARLRACYPSL